MTIYFQHVGEAGGTRDFPRTIGIRPDGLRRFQFADIESDLVELTTEEKDSLRSELSVNGDRGFQIWGVPSGAKSVLRDLQVGDYWLLLETVGPGGSFFYGGRVLARAPRECFVLSKKLWTEARFPIIILLDGNIINFRWEEFCERFGYNKNWNPAGRTNRLQSERLAVSPYGDEATFARHVIGIDFATLGSGPSGEGTLLDVVELDFSDEEGRRSLREHLQIERSYRLVSEFKRRLTNFSCSACGFDFEATYGALGRSFIEAHHIRAVSGFSEGNQTRISELRPVCSNCHRMLHRRNPMLSIDELKSILQGRFEERG